MHGVNQVQVNEEIGFTFAAALRAFLRQDPDVIMVGEIRDYETAEIGVKAALTGHLVLSTLHTNDAPSSITRLLDMGVEPFLVSSSIVLVAAQRLVRVICSACKTVASNFSPEALVEYRLRQEGGEGSQVLLRQGLRRLRGDRLPGTDRALRGAADQRRYPRPRRRPRPCRGHPQEIDRDGHADAAGQRDRQDPAGDDDDRGSAAGDGGRLSPTCVQKRT